MCGLFNDVFSRSDYVTSNERIIVNDELEKRERKWSWHNFKYYLCICLGAPGKTTKTPGRIVGLLKETCNRDLPNTKECWPVDHDVRSNGVRKAQRPNSIQNVPVPISASALSVRAVFVMLHSQSTQTATFPSFLSQVTTQNQTSISLQINSADPSSTHSNAFSLSHLCVEC
jgi:hypothetical protein